MKRLILLFTVAAAACTTQSNTAKQDSTAELVTKDQACAGITDEATCIADKSDGCHWQPVPIPALAGYSGPTGVCLGDTGDDPCVIVDQCSNIADKTTCGALANCEWVAAACPVAAPSTDGTMTTIPCNPYVCAPKNPCASLDEKSCGSNPECELVTGVCPPVACPAIACAPGQNCPPIDCPTPTCDPTPVCVHKDLSCETTGSTGSGSTGSGSTGSGSNGGGTSGGGGSAHPG